MMYTAPRTVITLIAVALMVLVVGAAPFAASQEPAQEPAPIQGALVSVDTEAMTITVMTADDMTVLFQYTAETKVTGGQESVAGLATTKDARVTVRFTEKGDTKIATEIEVQPAA
jgi:hypothetical protein